MSDIWSGVGVEIAPAGDGEWLYRVGTEVRGPVPLQVVAQKLVSGQIPLDAHVAKEGSSDFFPIARMRFRVHAAGTPPAEAAAKAFA